MAHAQIQSFHWTFESFEKHERGFVWYIFAGTIIGALLLYSVFSGNFLFGLLTLITAFILFVRHIVEPQKIDCEVTEHGIRVGSKIYPHHGIRFFWVIHGPQEIDMLYIQERGGLRSTLPIPVYDHDVQTIRTFLSQYIEEDDSRKFEPFSEMLARVLKL